MQIGKTANAKIPIVSDARLHQTSRGFLPWRFAYAGPGVRRPTFMGPPSANLHKLRRIDDEHMFSAPIPDIHQRRLAREMVVHEQTTRAIALASLKFLLCSRSTGR